MALIYKTLFEVKILHEFYMTDADGGTVFNLPSQQQRLTFLRNRFAADQENIQNDLYFDIPPDFKDIFSNYRFKLLPTYAGFRVVVEVNQTIAGDGTRSYHPKFPLPASLSIPVMIKKKSNRIDLYSFKQSRKNFQAVPYFTNEHVGGIRSYPFLSNPVPAFNAATLYEQGEIASFGFNDVRAFYRDNGGVVQWNPITGTGYTTPADDVVVPFSFYYTFGVSDNVSVCDFILTDKDGTMVETLTFSGTDPLGKISLRWDPARYHSIPSSTASVGNVYNLQVAGNNGYNKSFKLIFFNDEEALRDCWGLVQLNFHVTNNTLDLLDGAQQLITRRKPDGTFDPLHPVFEIHQRSKFAFWRYINDRNLPLQNGLHPDFLLSTAGILTTKIPRSLSYRSTLFKKPDNTPYYLPNPEPFEVLQEEAGKLYSNIYVSESQDLFPLGP
jgi:hypothetical protein